ncbi:MAG: S1 RNA-binding domain-containing protein [Anaerolineae bacterium]
MLELPVVGFNRGGLLVEWNGRQGFVPASHLEDLDPFLREEERERSLRAQMGRCLKLKVIEVDPERRRLVLSERATRSDENRRKAFLKQLTPGEIRKGRVTNIRSFGAFVDLGEGVEGLIHISEISWGRVNHPSDALHPGQEIDVYILNVDRERGRVGLSIKRTQPDPWETLERDYEVGQVVEGLITNVVNFGAFAEVEKGLEGLIHVSELAEGNFLHPRNVVQEGDTVQALIINMDGERRRLGLSLRRAPSVEAPEPEGPTIPSEE